MIAWFEEGPGGASAGGKGAALSAMYRAGIPVPPGFCVPPGASVGEADVAAALARLAAPAVAVRSSAVGEDSIAASFAGIHLSRLNVRSPAAVLVALEDVRASAVGSAALAYRAARGIAGEPRMAAVVQAMVWPQVSGVAFTRDPVTGAERVVVEATWGLGEAIVSGAVTPDRWVLAHDGTVLESAIGDKDVAIVAAEEGTQEVAVEPARRRVPCVGDRAVAAVADMALRCEGLFERAQDVEWVMAGEALWVLQSRPITT